MTRRPDAIGAASTPAIEADAGDSNEEIEIKFSTAAPGFKASMLAGFFGSAAFKTRSLRSIYFDTADWDLKKNGIALRIRKSGRAAPVLNVKSADTTTGDPFLRREIEVRSPGFIPDLDLFDPDTANALARIIGDRPLQAQFETLVRRTAALVGEGGSMVEIAFDSGAIAAGGLRMPLTEVELELKSGSAVDLYGLGIRLANDLPLSLDFVSKAEKGFRACGEAKAAAAGALPVAFGADATLDEAVAAVISNTLLQFVSNWAALRDSGSPESIHQLRVALRRMRSGLALFKRALPCAEIEELRREAKEIASALGEARECDVLIQSVRKGPLASPDRPQSCDLLLGALEQRRIKALDAARALIDARQTTLFVLKVKRFLAARAWRDGISGKDAMRLAEPASDFAARALDRLRTRALKRGAALPAIADAERHELRIVLKNLRYAAEFFAALFGHRKKRDSFLRCVSELQDLLGAHNDAVMAKELLGELAAGRNTDLDAASGFVVGWFARGVPMAEAKLGKSWKAFKRADAFWE